jgi:hypothetical protein
MDLNRFQNGSGCHLISGIDMPLSLAVAIKVGALTLELSAAVILHPLE